MTGVYVTHSEKMYLLKWQKDLIATALLNTYGYL